MRAPPASAAPAPLSLLLNQCLRSVAGRRLCFFRFKRRSLGLLADADAWCRRNILMLAVDDLRPLFGEAFGYPEVKTPNFDKNFLGEGLVFRTPLLPPHFCAQPLIAPRGPPAPAGNSYVQVAVCGPSRSSILTGRRPDSSHINAALNSWCW